MLWPIILTALAETFYQICAKSTPRSLNPFASLTVSYMVSAIASCALFFTTSTGTSITKEWRELNWTAFVLGLAIVAIETGSIFMYKAGWNINTGYLVKAMIAAIALIAVGYVLYHEPFSVKKGMGVALCMLGLVLINKA